MASNPDPAAIAGRRAVVRQLNAYIADEQYSDFIVEVSTFHRSLIEVTRNKTLIFLYQMLLHRVTAHQVDHLRRLPRPAGSQRKRLIGAVKSYEKVIDLIEARDLGGALAHWRLHLQNANATWADEVEAG